MPVLREVRESDLPTLYDQQREPAANLMAAVASRDWEDFLTHWNTKILPDPLVVKRVISLGEQVVGYIFSWIDGERRMIGYWIGMEYWGQGFGTQSLREFLELLRERPLYAKVAKHNIASTRVLSQFGFQLAKEGVFYSKVHACNLEEREFVLK